MVKLESLLEARNRHISQALSIAHGTPLHNVIKIKPPMVLSEEDVDETLSKLGLCLSEI
jgi:4-aminobutyrate aminotransferase-like enzyme